MKRIAIDQLQQQPPDIVLLDLNLPDMRGEQVLKWIRQQPELADLPVYVVSGSDLVDSPASGPSPDRVVQKPLNPQLLVQAMRAEACAI